MSRSDPIVERVVNDETIYLLNPKIVEFRRRLEQKLGHRPTLEETAAAWKARRGGNA
jgi:hypothetical protein